MKNAGRRVISLRIVVSACRMAAELIHMQPFHDIEAPDHRNRCRMKKNKKN